MGEKLRIPIIQITEHIKLKKKEYQSVHAQFHLEGKQNNYGRQREEPRWERVRKKVVGKVRYMKRQEKSP